MNSYVYKTVTEAMNAKENRYPGYFGLYLDGFSYLTPITKNNSVDMKDYSFVAKKTRLFGTIPFIFKMLENGHVKELLTGTEIILLNTNHDYLKKSDLGIIKSDDKEVFEDILKQIKRGVMPALIINNTNFSGFINGANYFSISPNFICNYEELLKDNEEKLKAYVGFAKNEAILKSIEAFDQEVKISMPGKVKTIDRLINNKGQN